MKPSKKQNMKNIKLKTLRKYLRTFADFPVPERLEDKIISEILPVTSSELKTQTFLYKWKFNLGAAAAVITLFVALMLVVNLSITSANANRASLPFDTTLCYPNKPMHYYLNERIDLTKDTNYVNFIDF